MNLKPGRTTTRHMERQPPIVRHPGMLQAIMFAGLPLRLTLLPMSQAPRLLGLLTTSYMNGLRPTLPVASARVALTL